MTTPNERKDTMSDSDFVTDTPATETPKSLVAEVGTVLALNLAASAGSIGGLIIAGLAASKVMDLKRKRRAEKDPNQVTSTVV